MSAKTKTPAGHKARAVRHWAVSLLALIGGFCCVTATAALALEPTNLGTLKAQLRDYHAHDYPLQIAGVMQSAGEWIRERAPQVNRPAIVLDIDETSLSNWEEIETNDFAYIATGECEIPLRIPCGARAWDRLARATAIQPTLVVYQEAFKNNIAVFFVTGRFEEERSSTELNLWKEGYRGWEKLIMRAESTGTVELFKTTARASIEAAGYSIIANIGDQDSDLRGGHAEKAFKVPNPFYWIP